MGHAMAYNPLIHAHHKITQALQFLGPHRVENFLLLILMRRPIHFDHQRWLVTEKIHDKAAQRCLPTKSPNH